MYLDEESEHRIGICLPDRRKMYWHDIRIFDRYITDETRGKRFDPWCYFKVLLCIDFKNLCLPSTPDASIIILGGLYVSRFYNDKDGN